MLKLSEDERYELLFGDDINKTKDIVFNILIRTIKAINAVAHISSASYWRHISFNGTINLNADVWFALKDTLIQDLLNYFRDRIIITYLYDPFFHKVHHRSRLHRTIMNVDSQKLYYDLLELADKQGNIICHSLPWRVNWKKCDNVRERDYWHEKEEYEIFELYAETIERLKEAVEWLFTYIYVKNTISLEDL